MPRCFHGASRVSLQNIMKHVIIPVGTRTRGGRKEVYFSPADPRGDVRDQFEVYQLPSEIIVMIDTVRAEQAGCEFFTATSGAALCQQTAPPNAFLCVFETKTGSILWTDETFDDEEEQRARGNHSRAPKRSTTVDEASMKFDDKAAGNQPLQSLELASKSWEIEVDFNSETDGGPAASPNWINDDDDWEIDKDEEADKRE